LLESSRCGADDISDLDDEKDELYETAVEFILKSGQASASYIQRRLKMGYARAARIIDTMETENIIGPSEGAKPREVLIDYGEYLKRKRRRRSTITRNRKARK
jgi:S-DNA-T family DNA segregation ATPase FtsK/SpoIIIE